MIKYGIGLPEQLDGKVDTGQLAVSSEGSRLCRGGKLLAVRGKLERLEMLRYRHSLLLGPLLLPD